MLRPGTAQHGPAAGFSKVGLLWCVLGLVATAAGFILPMALAGQPELTDLGWIRTEEARGELVFEARQENRPAGLVHEPEGVEYKPFRMVGGIVALVLFCAAMVWVAKRPRALGLRPSPDSEFQPLETLNLGNRCLIHLVKTSKALLLIAADGSGLKRFIPLPAPFESALEELTSESTTPGKEETDLPRQPESSLAI